jgi:pentatricopeptide repeat protein
LLSHGTALEQLCCNAFEFLNLNTLQPCTASERSAQQTLNLHADDARESFCQLETPLSSRLSFYNPYPFFLRLWTLLADPLVSFAVPENTKHHDARSSDWGYNGVITACSHSAQWHCALQLLRKMEEVQGCTTLTFEVESRRALRMQ